MQKQIDYRNFEDALRKLEDFLKIFRDSEIERAGVIQAFEFTFEQCWKVLQKRAAAEGVVLASPKKSFEWALQAGLIAADREEVWLSILTDRNLTSHTYREAMALQVSQNIKASYAGEFRRLLEKLKTP